MRSSIAGFPCSFSANPDATAIVYYQHGALDLGTPNSTAWPAWTKSVTTPICANVGASLVVFTWYLTAVQDALADTVPWFPITPDPAPPVTQVIDIEFGQNATDHWVVSISIPISNHELLSHDLVDYER